MRNVQRKYGGSYAAVREFYERASAEAEMLDNASERTEELAKEIARTGERLSREAEELGALRAAAAESFERDMTKELADLGMSGTTFKVKIDSDYSPDAVGETGGDRVEFLISPNVGEPLNLSQRRRTAETPCEDHLRRRDVPLHARAEKHCRGHRPHRHHGL